MSVDVIEENRTSARDHSYGPVVWDRDRHLYKRRDAPLIDLYGRLASTWIVCVYGYDDCKVVAFTRDEARYMTFVAFRDAYGGTFREFLARGVSVRLEPCR